MWACVFELGIVCWAPSPMTPGHGADRNPGARHLSPSLSTNRRGSLTASLERHQQRLSLSLFTGSLKGGQSLFLCDRSSTLLERPFQLIGSSWESVFILMYINKNANYGARALTSDPSRCISKVCIWMQIGCHFHCYCYCFSQRTETKAKHNDRANDWLLENIALQ